MGLAISALIFTAVLSLWLVPDWLGRPYVGSERVTAADNVRTASVAFLVIIGSSVTIFYTARTYSLAREGHITDRYSKAVEHLGDVEKLDVRLGGIYALERIARDSKRDQAAITEILAAFVRGHSQLGESNPLPAPGSRLATDVQAALTVLGRLPERFGMPPIDLRFCNLDSADLSHAHLPAAVFAYSLLRDVNLSSTNLRGADLSNADLTYSTLVSCDLRDANLEQAILDRANAEAANLSKADLSYSKLHMTHLASAKLCEADMQTSELSGPRPGEGVFFGTGRGQYRAEQMNGVDVTETKLPLRLEDLNLRNVVGLTQHQLDQVWTIRVSLPDGLSARSMAEAKPKRPEAAAEEPRTDKDST